MHSIYNGRYSIKKIERYSYNTILVYQDYILRLYGLYIVRLFSNLFCCHYFEGLVILHSF